jgi:outer membrane protein assembly factor BamB
VAEGDLVFAASGEGTLALRLDGRKGDLTGTNVVWRNRRARPSIPSPLVYRGHVYLAGGNGLVTCLAAATGKQVWKERLGEQEYHASPVAGAGRVYFAGKEGVVRVVEAGPKFRLLAANDLGEPIIASPALSDGEIFIRGKKHLFCIGGK